MSKQELSALLGDSQRFEEFVRAAFAAFDIKHDGHLCQDEVEVFLSEASRDLHQPVPDEDTVREVTEYIGKTSTDLQVSYKDFKAFLEEVFQGLISETE